jgi:hypothetical protein
MTIKEQVTQTIENLSEFELQEVAQYLAFLKYRARLQTRTLLDKKNLAALYGEFADEDRQMAEEGVADYLFGFSDQSEKFERTK